MLMLFMVAKAMLILRSLEFSAVLVMWIQQLLKSLVVPVKLQFLQVFLEAMAILQSPCFSMEVPIMYFKSEVDSFLS
jgi:hypothetical protein